MSKAKKNDHKTDDVQNATSLLNPQEYRLCNQLASGSKPWSQRAIALLAINEGASETVASEHSQLRIAQVKFWLDKFNKVGMDMFPEHLLKGEDKISGKPTEIKPEEDIPTLDETGNTKKLKKSKRAKDNKGKDKKKKFKAKKGKRSKKLEKAESAGSKRKKKKNKS